MAPCRRRARTRGVGSPSFRCRSVFFNEVREHLGADTFAQSAAKTQQRTLTQWAIFSGAHSGGRRM
jgi:hypothetical protein